MRGTRRRNRPPVHTPSPPAAASLPRATCSPLINQGARTEDVAASIYKAVVNQTIAGLAQGRPIQGNILYLGGPLTFSTVLRKSFDEALGVTGTCPEHSLL